MLNIKQKWEIEAQLGKMLRDAEGQSTRNREEEFREQLFALIKAHRISNETVTEMLRVMK